jgi:hypothetical protein
METKKGTDFSIPFNKFEHYLIIQNWIYLSSLEF